MIPGIVAGAGGLAPAAGAALGYLHAASAGEVTDAADVYTDVLSHTFAGADLKPNATYLVIWNAEGSNQTSAAGFFGQLMIGGVSQREQRIDLKEVTAPDDYVPFGGFGRYEPGASPADVTFKVQMKRRGSGIGAAKNATLTLLELGDDDYYSESLAPQTWNTDTNFTTAATLSFTPASAGDYLILVSHVIGNGNTGVNSFWHFGDGTTATPDFGMSPPNVALQQPVMNGLRIDSMSGAKTITLQHKTNVITSGGASTIGQIVMCALRLDRFAAANIITLGADNSGTDVAYTTALSQTFTPAAADHLALAMWGQEGSSATLTCQSRFDDDGTITGELIREPHSTGNGSSYVGGFGHRVAAYSAASRTQKIERLSETTGVTTRVKAQSMIATLDLTGI